MTSKNEELGPGMRPKVDSLVDQHVGARIRSLRIMKGLSQTKLAERSGITFQQVQKYENGTNRVSPSRLMEFAELLGVEPQYFFEGAPNPMKTDDAPLAEAIRSFASSREGISIAKSFARLSPTQRRAVVRLVQEIASLELAPPDAQFSQREPSREAGSEPPAA